MDPTTTGFASHNHPRMKIPLDKDSPNGFLSTTAGLLLLGFSECLLWNKPRKKTFSMVPISLLRTALWFPFYEYRQKSTKRPQCIFPSLHVMSRPA
ncbi:hypothetical protein B9Z55_026522 [Caenorhabditis nigoni]|uniref:Uncharacterized protein n=1 Tax=Caenorhabditis nigoni TaxID=1611254 RepID=A0A2G5T351_9PELO|nr:hypothetical protein B9Z55_026522 [Caenorhabditis nigoni]